MRPSRKVLFFLVLGLMVSGILLAAADFGESSDSLGQITDEFTSLDNVSVRVLIERNATLNAMELNFSVGGGLPRENYTEYIKNGVDSRLTVTDFNISTNPDFRRGTDEGYYLDLGAGNIGDFQYNFQYVVSDVEAGDADSRNMGGYFAVANWIGSFGDRPGGTYDYLAVLIRNVGSGDNQYTIQFIAGQNGALVTQVISATEPVSTDIIYCTVNRTLGDVYFWAFSDSARTIPLMQLNDTDGGFSDTVQYLYGWMAIDANQDPNDWFVGSVANLINGTGTPPGFAADGYFSTTDQLSGINGSVLVQLTNATIPAGTGITAEFSVDNSTWLNPTSLKDGHGSIDLRDLNWSTFHYVRYNLSTSDPSETPRLYQSRLITTEGPAGAAGPGAPGLNVSGVWVEYRASAINFTVGAHAGGDLNSTFDIDGDTWNHTEVVGAPGSVISINFTGVDPDAECIWVTIWYLYDGNLQHDFDIELWNFTSSAWVDDGHIVDGVAFSWINSTIYAMRIPLDFLSGGEVRVQLNHESPGNVNHDLFIDYVRLVAKVPGDVGAGAVTVIVVESDFPWIALAIILMCVAYLLFSSR